MDYRLHSEFFMCVRIINIKSLCFFSKSFIKSDIEWRLNSHVIPKEFHDTNGTAFIDTNENTYYHQDLPEWMMLEKQSLKMTKNASSSTKSLFVVLMPLFHRQMNLFVKHSWMFENSLLQHFRLEIFKSFIFLYWK